MNHDVHGRASQLLAQRRIESLSPGDERWLSTHLAECEFCAAADARLTEALSTPGNASNAFSTRATHGSAETASRRSRSSTTATWLRR